MKLEKANKRDRKRNKRKYGMRVDGGSVFVIIEAQRKRDAKLLLDAEDKKK